MSVWVDVCVGVVFLIVISQPRTHTHLNLSFSPLSPETLSSALSPSLLLSTKNPSKQQETYTNPSPFCLLYALLSLNFVGQARGRKNRLILKFWRLGLCLISALILESILHRSSQQMRMVKEIKKINDHLDNLKGWVPNELVLRELENTCFYELAMLSNFQHKFRHSHPLLQVILSCYDTELRLFKFGGQNILFGLEDIVHMTRLNVDGDAVSGWNGDFEGVSQTYLRNEGKVGKTGCVSLAWLRKNFEDVPARALDDPEELFCYIRAYVMFIIGCFVCPDPSGKFVSISFLRLLNTKEDFNRYAWVTALLAHLRSLDSFFNPKTKGNLARHSYSLMLFAIERVLCLGLYLMENSEPDESDITTFKKGRPVEFPLLRGWAEKLHHVTHDNHDGKDARSFAGILRTVSPDEVTNIEWQPYQRLGVDFLPQHLMGQK